MIFGRNNVFVKKYRSWKQKQVKRKEVKELLREIDELKDTIRSKQSEIDTLNGMLENKSELLEKADSEVRIQKQEIDLLNAVIVRNLKRVEAESRIIQEPA